MAREGRAARSPHLPQPASGSPEPRLMRGGREGEPVRRQAPGTRPGDRRPLLASAGLRLGPEAALSSLSWGRWDQAGIPVDVARERAPAGGTPRRVWHCLQRHAEGASEFNLEETPDRPQTGRSLQTKRHEVCGDLAQGARHRRGQRGPAPRGRGGECGPRTASVSSEGGVHQSPW